MVVVILFLLIGLVSGALAGLIGIAGGLFLIPTLVFFFGYSEKLAQGTTLAILLPPVGLAATYLYWRHGNVDVRAAIYIAIGFFIGGFFGASESAHLSNATLTRIFGFLALAVGVKMLFFS